MQIRKQSAFTMIEMLVVMMLISIFLLLTMTSKGLSNLRVIENNNIRFLKLKVGKIINVAKVDIIAFDKKGNINKFGSITIYNNNSIYRIIFHIEKGRIRYEKL